MKKLIFKVDVVLGKKDTKLHNKGKNVKVKVKKKGGKKG